MNIIHVSGLNVYDPTDEQILAMSKADAVKWTGRGEGRFYNKVGVQGPIKHGPEILYMIRLGPEITVPAGVVGSVTGIN